MTTLELKKMLISRIKEINDISFLYEIKTIIESKVKVQKLTLVLTLEQRNEIIESKKEIENGCFIEQSELDKKIDRWAKSR